MDSYDYLDESVRDAVREYAKMEETLSINDIFAANVKLLEVLGFSPETVGEICDANAEDIKAVYDNPTFRQLEKIGGVQTTKFNQALGVTAITQADPDTRLRMTIRTLLNWHKVSLETLFKYTKISPEAINNFAKGEDTLTGDEKFALAATAILLQEMLGRARENIQV